MIPDCITWQLLHPGTRLTVHLSVSDISPLTKPRSCSPAAEKLSQQTTVIVVSGSALCYTWPGHQPICHCKEERSRNAPSGNASSSSDSSGQLAVICALSDKRQTHLVRTNCHPPTRSIARMARGRDMACRGNRSGSLKGILDSNSPTTPSPRLTATKAP